MNVDLRQKPLVHTLAELDCLERLGAVELFASGQP